MYVATLSVNDDKVVIDEVYGKQSELLEKVHQAIESLWRMKTINWVS